MKVLLVEDSLVVRKYIEGVLRGEPDVELLPTVSDGAAGVRAAVALRPDVILMDLELPVLSGLDAIREIMDVAPCPIVVLSAYLDSPEGDRAFDSLQAGAVDVVAKPSGLGTVSVERFRAKLLSTLRLMARAVVVRRKRPVTPPPEVSKLLVDLASLRLVVIGASTGGPPVLFELLRGAPACSPVPIVIAQHIIPGFEHGLASWLSGTGQRVVVVTGGEPLASGHVYIAPADRHVVINEGRLRCLPSEPSTPTPSVDLLFTSAAELLGRGALGVLLSGMGDDGARGLLALRRQGAVTITQERTTCAVDGMTAVARDLGASAHELRPEAIAAVFRTLMRAR